MRKIPSNPNSVDIIEQLEAKINSLENKLVHLESLYFTLHQNTGKSLSHQIKRAKQWFFSGAKAWLTFAPGCRPRRILKRILVACRNYALYRPWLKSLLLHHSTRLEHILRRINSTLIQSNDTTTSEKQSTAPLKEMTPRAQEIYTKLTAHFLGK